MHMKAYAVGTFSYNKIICLFVSLFLLIIETAVPILTGLHKQ